MSGRGSVGERVLNRCEQLPGAQLTFPFGPTPAVFKVGGRIFALISGVWSDVGRESVSLKCEPDYAAALVREHAGITPGYHLNKRHWITVDLTARLPKGLVEDLLIDSYDLVVDALPRSRRPVGNGPG